MPSKPLCIGCWTVHGKPCPANGRADSVLKGEVNPIPIISVKVSGFLGYIG